MESHLAVQLALVASCLAATQPGPVPGRSETKQIIPLTCQSKGLFSHYFKYHCVCIGLNLEKLLLKMYHVTCW